jgi:pyruvyltransferase
MPYLFKPVVQRKKGIGIIKHYADQTRLDALSSDEIREINAQQDPLKVIQEICECDVILSSSLHGVIIADSYGIPACWLNPEAKLWIKPEPIIKYQDYYLSTHRDPVVYEYTQESLNIDKAIKIAFNNRKPMFNCLSLLKTFPFLRSEITSLEDLNQFIIQSNPKLTS